MAGAAAAFGPGCAGQPEIAQETTTGSGGAGGATTASAGGNGAGTGGEGQGGFGFDAGIDAGPLSGCATASAKAEPLPLDLYVMLDQSGSMLGAKWSAVTQALDAFVQGQNVTDLGVGLQYFPLPGQQVCDYMAYGTPAVPIEPLATNATKIAQSLAQHAPDGETPTLPALQGAYTYTKAWAKANPTHTVVVVLATDGEPNVCGSTIDNVAQAANVGATVAPNVRTFVIGVGTSLGSLDAIAAAGGTEKAYLVDDAGQSTKQEFLAALNTIRGSALPCEYAIPKPDGQKLDYAKVNVVYTPGGGMLGVVPQVPTEADCQGSPEAWYYDDPNAPTKVVFCDGLCQEVKADAAASVDVVFGCETQIAK